MLREVKLLKVTLLVNGSAMTEIQMCYIQSLWGFFFYQRHQALAMGPQDSICSHIAGIPND